MYHEGMVSRCVPSIVVYFSADHKARPFPCNHQETDTIYTSVVTFALGLVTLTLSCFARAMISTRFREETLWAILLNTSVLRFSLPSFCLQGRYGSGLSGVLSGVGLVVHQQELDILDVVDDEGLVAGGHHVAGLLVGAESDL